ncbi:Glycosyltransferase involved in cell wall bisynthesis [Friedmanniella luteola]|uniref:Glycosyltransferase involved in cell wall bisynthesis n=1 Tax=Friedmanniella luteola TaxID=546871 RepID=A0A1H1YDN6_9ACTN|nr:glycosyltransferase family 4 protein [Friedmanniella luteola]SDT19504.1 Glycosyltransferase involved in cell wall bisynthesis [Friedmanniella luteola]
MRAEDPIAGVGDRHGTAAGPPLHVVAHARSLDPLGGVEICTLEDSRALSARGHRVDLAFSEEGSLRPAYESLGSELAGPYAFDFSPRHAVRDLAGFRRSARWVRQQRPDVVWLNRAEHLVWAQVASRAAGAPVVAHLHGPPVYRRMRVAGAGVAHFIAVSDFVRDSYIERGVAPERITRIHNAVDPRVYPAGGITEQDQARRQLGLEPGVPVVLSYGQMTTSKGLLTLLASWHEVLTAEPAAVLVLVDASSGRPDAAVEAELRRLPVSSYRRFPITDHVVPFLHASDVVAFPSWLPEAFGRVVLEGLSTGRPVVASDVGAVGELLTGPMAHLLVPPRDAEALAATLVSTLGWRARDPDLQDRCVRWVAERFPAEAHVDALEGVLQQYRR